MRKTSYQQYQFAENEKYICFNCQNEISYVGDYRRYCGTIAPKCVICFEDPEPNEEVLIFSCYNSYAHKTHAETWLREHKTCPYCSSSSYQLIKVEETTQVI